MATDGELATTHMVSWRPAGRLPAVKAWLGTTGGWLGRSPSTRRNRLISCTTCSTRAASQGQQALLRGTATSSSTRAGPPRRTAPDYVDCLTVPFADATI